MLLSYSLSSLRDEFGLSSFQAGSLGSITLTGMAVGGAYNFGRLRAVFAPAIIGLLAAQVSIAGGMLVMGLAYLLTALIPARCIRDKIYDPQKA
jgi:AAHS family cis,cis-muconate transporter-like MFS transporter